jgi:cytochrome c-type biogenesis protein CcmH/NrfG
MQSVHLLYYRSQSHVHLGEALMAAGHLDRAIRAFEAADMLDPTNIQAKRWLTRALRKRQQDWQRQIDDAGDDTAGDVT